MADLQSPGDITVIGLRNKGRNQHRQNRMTDGDRTILGGRWQCVVYQCRRNVDEAGNSGNHFLVCHFQCRAGKADQSPFTIEYREDRVEQRDNGVGRRESPGISNGNQLGRPSERERHGMIDGVIKELAFAPEVSIQGPDADARGRSDVIDQHAAKSVVRERYICFGDDQFARCDPLRLSHLVGRAASIPPTSVIVQSALPSMVTL